MDLSSLSNEQLIKAMRDELQKYISLPSDRHEIHQDNIYKNLLIGEILKELRKRNNGLTR